MFLIIFESNDTLKEYCTDNSTNKNIFLFKDKNHYLSNICGEEHVISNKNKSTWREKFICLENIDMKDHFPTEIHSFSYDPVLSNFKNLRIISLYNVEIPFDSFKDISIEDFKKPNLLSIGYFMKSVNSEEIVRAYSIFGSNILKT
ncbi:hypothetical protein CWI38_0463p0010 [Hamiltosporidium tvaerminnensis]|uniref:Uncharacterized protein n=1 Tax=Hamiltosporidium tvaerminnensis TaxID=1176355 RepID=A0A4Q9LZY8_9MICR|nr:hypothetical protein CWI38_0463p0010 [Hamiltosporidium tvaerminnensis]